MPELPEVESTVRYLRERLLDLPIIGVDVNWKRSVDRPASSEFKKNIIGSKVVDVQRRGKYIVMSLQRGRVRQGFLLGHLRMSGSMDVVGPGAPIAKHDRIILHFKNGKQLRFNDPRKFGRMYWVRNSLEVTSKLGREPLELDFTAQVFHQILRTKRGRIKSVLLDQTLIAGVGNIYADECLWRAGIHPLRRACSISWVEAELLLGHLRAILLEAIEANGTDAGDGVVEGGMYSPKAYGRDGESCQRCQSILKRIVVGQRGTHFCPGCQKLRKAARKSA